MLDSSEFNSINNDGYMILHESEDEYNDIQGNKMFKITQKNSQNK